MCCLMESQWRPSTSQDNFKDITFDYEWNSPCSYSLCMYWSCSIQMRHEAECVVSFTADYTNTMWSMKKLWCSHGAFDLKLKPSEFDADQLQQMDVFNTSTSVWGTNSLELRRSLLLRLRLGLLLCSHHPADALDWQVHLLLRVVVIKLTQVGDEWSGERWRQFEMIPQVDTRDAIIYTCICLTGLKLWVGLVSIVALNEIRWRQTTS